MAPRFLPCFSHGLLSRASRSAAWLPLIFAMLVLLSARIVHAQALPTAKGPGSRIEVGAGISGFKKDYGQPNILGTTYYADLYPHWRYGLEGEARFLNKHTLQDVTLRTLMIGPKITLLPHPGRIEPFAKAMVGTGHIVLPYHYGQGDFLAVSGGGGVDVAVGDWIKIRAFDFEYQRWKSFPFGKMRPYGVTTGITLRLTSYHRYPEGNPHWNRISR